MDEAAALESYRARLSEGDADLIFAPVRHHSPACAWAVRELIREVQPREILIEAPVDLQGHIELLLAEETRPPVALAVFTPREAHNKLAAYYPFCAHSPEYVALCEGAKIGANLSFIDLPSADKAMLATPTDDTLIVGDEDHFDSGDFVRELCSRTGCRDGFELWDHLFESRLGSSDWREFFADVGAYCAALRAATPAAVLAESGDEKREAHMRAAIQTAQKQPGPVLVLTGGFHTPALLEEPAAAAKSKPIKHKSTKQHSEAFLIRYSFAALDALNGYAAGLPQPGYYDYLWQQVNANQGQLPWSESALDLISQFTAQMRAAGHNVSVPAQVELLRVAASLAALRGRPGPARHDLLDAARTALVKGQVAAQEIWTERLTEFLRGDAIGDIPASAGSPPIVEDARARAQKLRINVGDGARQRRHLDIRRKPTHLTASRFFQAMTMLGTDFAVRQAGPDFINNIDTGRLFEEWEYAWSPAVEGRLIELSTLGDNIVSACVGWLRQQVAEMQTAGQSRDIAGLSQLLIQGVLAGLDEELADFLGILSVSIQNHADFSAVVFSLRHLHNVAYAQGPLQTDTELPFTEVARAAYARLVYLCDDLPATPPESIQDRMEALRVMLELFRAPHADTYDRDLFDAALLRVTQSRPPPQILGAVLAITLQAGLVDQAAICTALAGNFGGTTDDEMDRVGVLSGLLFTAPEVMWQSEQILQEIDGLLTGLDEAAFLALLPNLRLAFTALNPRETDKVAAVLARMHGGQAPDFVGQQNELSEQDLGAGLALEQALRASINSDELSVWLEQDDE